MNFPISLRQCYNVTYSIDRIVAAAVVKTDSNGLCYTSVICKWPKWNKTYNLQLCRSLTTEAGLATMEYPYLLCSLLFFLGICRCFISFKTCVSTCVIFRLKSTNNIYVFEGQTTDETPRTEPEEEQTEPAVAAPPVEEKAEAKPGIPHQTCISPACHTSKYCTTIHCTDLV